MVARQLLLTGKTQKPPRQRMTLWVPQAALSATPILHSLRAEPLFTLSRDRDAETTYYPSTGIVILFVLKSLRPMQLCTPEKEKENCPDDKSTRIQGSSPAKLLSTRSAKWVKLPVPQVTSLIRAG